MKAEAIDFEPYVEHIEISGYRSFSGFSATPGPLTVIIGANGTGKTNLFDVLRLVSNSVKEPLPRGIDGREAAGTSLLHSGGPPQIDVAVTIPMGRGNRLRLEVGIQGPLGAPCVTSSPGMPPAIQDFVASWRFYSGFDVGPRAMMRQPVHVARNPVLAEDGSNLTAVLSSLVLEHREAYEELEMHLRAMIPGFESLGVRACGVGEIAIGTWREQSVEEELTLGDLSEGALRVLCWLTLACSPNLPPVVCIDGPEIGLHPRVLPMLAGALKIASARSQILIATHSPYFLSQFDLDEIAVMRKEDGRSAFVRPATSNALRYEVERRGSRALASLFLSEELEVLP